MYTKIFSIIDKCVVDKVTRNSLKQAFNYYEEEDKMDLFEIVFSHRKSGFEVLNEAFNKWESDEEKMKVISELRNISDDSQAKHFRDSISIALKDEKNVCSILDEKIKNNDKSYMETLIYKLGTRKKNEYTVKALGNNFVELFLSLSKDRQIQLLDSLYDCNHPFDRATSELIYRLRVEDLVTEKDEIEPFNTSPDMTIGVEIETIGDASTLLLDGSRDYTVQEQTLLGENWRVSKDDSIGPYGVEVISPVMHNTKQDSTQLFAICKLLKIIGNVPSEMCGGHIHIGADYFKSVWSLVNLYEIIGNCEEIYYLVASEEGEFSPNRIEHSLKPISEKLSIAIKNGNIDMSSLTEFANSIKNVQGTFIDGRIERPDKGYGINILNYGLKEPLDDSGYYLHTGVNTIEFRANSCPDTYEGWVKNKFFNQRLVEISEELGQIEMKQNRTEEEQRKINLREKLKDEESSVKKIEFFLELLFDREKDREIYRKRFLSNYQILHSKENEEVQKKFKHFRIDFNREKEKSEQEGAR